MQDICIKAAFNYFDQMLVVHVEDKGIGIKQDEMEKIFKLFGKIERTTQIN